MGLTGRNGRDDSHRLAGRYRLVEKLGTGGMSVVWRGYDETLGRSVAVKVLSPRLADDQMFRDRLRQEALAAARLSHPNITGIFDFGEAPLDERLTVPYVVMELNDGESVAARITRQGALAWRDAVTIGAEVASALATAHARGVVHRDVTPANVMLTGAGAKVVDFGISAIVGQRDAAPDGSLLGTPAYLAPERLGGAQVSAATDVYALGLLLYRALTGRLPWPAETTAEALRAHLYADPDPLPLIAGLPEGVRDLCLRCLAKSPSGRPGAAEVARALAAEVGLQPIIPPLTAREARASRVAAETAEADASHLAAELASSAPHAELASPADSSQGVVTTTVGSPPAGPLTTVREPASAGSPSEIEVPVWGSAVLPDGSMPAPRPALGRAFLAYLGLPGGTAGPRPSFGLLRLRAGLKIGSALRIGVVRPMGGGLFAGGGLARDMLTGRALHGGGLVGGARPTDGRPVRSGAFGGRYRIQAALVTAALAGTAGLSWAVARDSPDDEQAQAAGAGVGAVAAAPTGAVCAVRYQLRRDSGADYEALLTVAAPDAAAVGQWRVQFSYPGSQRLTGGPKAVTQKGRKVVAKGHGTRKSFTLRGDYRGYNPFPLSFTLDGHRCRAEVLSGLTAARPEGEPVSEPIGQERKPARDEGGDEARRNRPRKSSVPQRRVHERKPTPAVPSTPPGQVAGRMGDGFSLAL